MQFRNLLTLFLSALPLALAADLKNNAITAPIAGDVITAGQPYSIKWINPKGNLVTITLIDGPANQVKPVKEIVANAPNNGVYTWSVPDDLPPSTTYAIRITYNNNPADFNYSDRFTFENENVVSSAAVSSRAETSTAASSVASSETEATTTEAETASSTVASTESETTSGAASSETEATTSRATETTQNTRGSSSTVSRATRTSPAIETGMAPVDEPSSASRSSGQSLIVAIAGMVIGGALLI